MNIYGLQNVMNIYELRNVTRICADQNVTNLALSSQHDENFLVVAM